MRSPLIAVPFLLTMAVAGCESGGTSNNDCIGAKCDTPGGDAVAVCAKECQDAEDLFACQLDCMHEQAIGHCEARRADTIESSRRGLVPDAIRWAAADVEGVNQNNGDDRGQEYTEYFALVQPPAKVEGGEMPEAVIVGKNTGRDPLTGNTTTTPLSIDLTEDQIFWLEDHPDEVVGQCVFTSWHQDVPGPLCGRDTGCESITAFPAGPDHAYCTENEGYCDSVEGFNLTDTHQVMRRGAEITEPLFRMVIGFNSNGAASSLVRDCGVVPEDVFEEDALIEDDFVRGCMLTGPSVADENGNRVPVEGSITGFGTEWRRSDSAICAASMRLHECGCGVDTDSDGVPDITDPAGLGLALIPPQPQNGAITLRGFPLGTWSGFALGDPENSQLPANCRYADTGDGSQTIVTCDLTASDLFANANDMKGVCRSKYGDDIVTHIPVPADAIACTPDTSKKFTGNCGAMPWVIGDENGAGAPGTE